MEGFVLDNVRADGGLEDIGERVGVAGGSPVGAVDGDYWAAGHFVVVVVVSWRGRCGRRRRCNELVRVNREVRLEKVVCGQRAEASEKSWRCDPRTSPLDLTDLQVALQKGYKYSHCTYYLSCYSYWYVDTFSHLLHEIHVTTSEGPAAAVQ